MSRRLTAALVATLALLVSGCSDDDRTGTHTISGPKAVLAVADLPNTVEGMINVLFDKPTASVMQLAWKGVQFSMQRGHKEIARLKMFLMAEATKELQKRSKLRDPDGSGSATVAQGVAKLFSLMFGAVFPELPPPPQLPSGDAVVVLVDGRAQTAVTPSKQAGIDIPAGSTNTPFFLVIEENTQLFPSRCSGPLRTRRCQFPLFYTFTPYPHVRLLKKAKFGVCTMHSGIYGPDGEGQHGRMRLAHNLPDGAVDENGEGIKVMDVLSVDFLDCARTHYDPPERLGLNPFERGARWVGRRFAQMLTPKDAYALDRGGGGEDDFFSPFNAVDTLLATADLTVPRANVFPATVLPGETAWLDYSVKNIGAGSSSASQHQIVFATDAALTQNVQTLATLPIPAFAVGESLYVARAVTIPSVSAGAYYIGVIADIPDVVPESNEGNNRFSTAVTVVQDFDFNLQSQGTATIDGVLAAGEWANASCRDLAINTPSGGVTTGKVCVMSDETKLYLALSFVRLTLDPGNTLSFEFDSDGSGNLNDGDDGIILNPQIGFKDLVRFTCTGSSGTGLCSFFDSDQDGTHDGAAAFAHSGFETVYEMSHPLQSGDANDFARAPGDELRFFLSLRMIEAGGTFPTGFGDTDWPAFGRFAKITLAPPLSP